MNARRGIVSLAGQRAGVIEEIGRGPHTRFTYDPEWLKDKNAKPISLTLPLREEPYESENLHPFFANLLAEGWLLEVSSKRLKISKDDPFGLLLATCRDCIGAVEIQNAEGHSTQAT